MFEGSVRQLLQFGAAGDERLAHLIAYDRKLRVVLGASNAEFAG
jgi:hypothetical protein